MVVVHTKSVWVSIDGIGSASKWLDVASIATGITKSAARLSWMFEHRSRWNWRGSPRHKHNPRNLVADRYRIGLTTRRVVTPLLSVYSICTTRSSGACIAAVRILRYILFGLVFETSNTPIWRQMPCVSILGIDETPLVTKSTNLNRGHQIVVFPLLCYAH